MVNNTRQNIINNLIVKYNYKSYLEVGTQNPSSCFDAIKCENKFCIEPFPWDSIDKSKINFIGTSDDYFESIKNSDITYDIVFIDGLHHDDQVLRDIDNSLKHLSENGTIIVHDCLPKTESQQERNDHGGVWLGDVWKAIAYLRINRDDISIQVIDTDLGCGIIKRGYNKKWIVDSDDWKTYDYYNSNKKELMNIISVQDWKI